MSTEQETAKTPTIDELLAASAATPDFIAAVRQLAADNRPSDRVRFGAGNPPVKVLRAVCGLLEHSPALAIASVEVAGQSGCSDYRGEILVNGGAHKFRFTWDCAWKASQLGWTDYFGEPDQIRAARTYGYRCFERFEEI